MYNPNKYNYQPMQRVEVDGKRRYATPDGEKLPSVTTILDATKLNLEMSQPPNEESVST